MHEHIKAYWLLITIAVVVIFLLSAGIYLLGSDVLERYKLSKLDRSGPEQLDTFDIATDEMSKGNFDEAAAQFQKVAETSDDIELKMEALSMQADALEKGSNEIDAIRVLKELIGNESFPDEDNQYKQSAFDSLIDYASATSTLPYYKEVFLGEPNIFGPLLVQPAEDQTTHEQSIKNLIEYAQSYYFYEIGAEEEPE